MHAIIQRYTRVSYNFYGTLHRMLSESHIIQLLQTEFPEHIGDDAACLPLNHEQSYVIAKDLLVENRHFRLSYQDAQSLAHKALHVNLSDIAAMGATPQFVLLGLAIPEHFEPNLDAFLHAFSKACKAASVLLIGGDTTGSSHDLLISITAIGMAATTHIKRRSTVKPGDLLYITGNLGYAHLGLTALEEKNSTMSEFKRAFLKPNARMQEGIWFGQQSAVTGMMDISDGLWVDVNRMCSASQCGMRLNLDACKPSTAFNKTAKNLNLDPITVQLIGGEDYGLMLAVTPKAHLELAADFKQKFGYELSCIGKFTAGNNITLLEHDKPSLRKVVPFSHFS
jgi:thiamine-monophosphate kinase